MVGSRIIKNRLQSSGAKYTVLIGQFEKHAKITMLKSLTIYSIYYKKYEGFLY